MIEILLEAQNGDTLSLSRDLGYVIRNIDGLSPQDATINFQQSIRVYGRTHTGASVSGRDITIQMYIEKQPEQARKAIYSVARPGDQLTIHIKDDNITYKVTGYVANVDVGYFEQLTTAQIAIQCESPYLESTQTTQAIGSNVRKKFKFPVHTGAGESFVFGETKEKARIVVKNEGEVDTGAVFRVRVSQDVQNISIVNINSGEVMGIRGTLTASEILEISTQSGKRKIIIIDKATGTKAQALARKTPDFDWLQIYQGENIFEVQCEDSTKISIECTYTEKHLGV